MTGPRIFRSFTGLWLGLIALALGVPGAYAQMKPKVTPAALEVPKSMIWIGNSFFYYNNSMHGHFFQLVKAADAKASLRQSSVTISGSGFGWHDVAAYFKPGGIGSYSFDPNNNVVFNKIDKLFDVAIMMDCSQCPIHPQLSATFTEFAKSYSETARKSGAAPVFFMSWAYADKPEMTEQLADAYVKAGNDNGALVVPVGIAFARSVAKRPDLNLYDPDKRHPSLAGTYLGAAVMYAALYKKSPVGLAYDAKLGAETAAFLQGIAQETVEAFYK